MFWHRFSLVVSFLAARPATKCIMDKIEKTLFFINPSAADNSKTIIFKAPERADNSQTLIFVVGPIWNFKGSQRFEHAICGILRETAAKAATHGPANAVHNN